MSYLKETVARIVRTMESQKKLNRNHCNFIDLSPEVVTEVEKLGFEVKRYSKEFSGVLSGMQDYFKVSWNRNTI